jgi:hypothetical protein
MHHVHSSRFTATEIQPATFADRSTGEIPAGRSVQSPLDWIRRAGSAGGRDPGLVRLGCRLAPAPYPTADRDHGDDPAYDDNGPEDRLEQPEPALDFRNLD